MLRYEYTEGTRCILLTPNYQAAVLLWSALQSRKSFFNPYRLESYVADFLLNVAGILFAITAYSSAPLLLNALLITPAIIITFLSKPQHGSKKAGKSPQTRAPSSGKSNAQDLKASGPTKLPTRPFLTNYRGTMMIVTCLAILAVDFRIFPRRFAKAENWGTSLMDLGVGSFVFSAGVVSARAILSKPNQGIPKPLPKRLVSAARHSIPLFILGLIRLYSVKGLDYAEHVTEYGVHWNFFFTLSCLAPFVEVFHSLATTVIPSYDVLAILLGIIYEGVLNNTDLKAYILISPRGDSLLSKNREGIFSFIGYLAIFLLGRGTGLVVIPDGPSSQSTSKPKATTTTAVAAKTRRTILLRSLFLRSLAWWLLYYITTTPQLIIPPFLDLGFGISVSRRLANLPYILWISAFNDSQILFFCAIETFYFPSVHQQQTSPSKSNSKARTTATEIEIETAEAEAEAETAKVATPLLLHSYNQNGLPIFLVANLLTGMVNLLFPTLDMKPLASMGVLICYAAVVTGFAVGLQRWGVRIRV